MVYKDYYRAYYKGYSLPPRVLKGEGLWYLGSPKARRITIRLTIRVPLKERLREPLKDPIRVRVEGLGVLYGLL